MRTLSLWRRENRWQLVFVLLVFAWSLVAVVTAIRLDDTHDTATTRATSSSSSSSSPRDGGALWIEDDTASGRQLQTQQQVQPHLGAPYQSAPAQGPRYAAATWYNRDDGTLHIVGSTTTTTTTTPPTEALLFGCFYSILDLTNQTTAPRVIYEQLYASSSSVGKEESTCHDLLVDQRRVFIAGVSDPGGVLAPLEEHSSSSSYSSYSSKNAAYGMILDLQYDNSKMNTTTSTGQQEKLILKGGRLWQDAATGVYPVAITKGASSSSIDSGGDTLFVVSIATTNSGGDSSKMDNPSNRQQQQQQQQNGGKGNDPALTFFGFGYQHSHVGIRVSAHPILAIPPSSSNGDDDSLVHETLDSSQWEEEQQQQQPFLPILNHAGGGIHNIAGIVHVSSHNNNEYVIVAGSMTSSSRGSDYDKADANGGITSTSTSTSTSSNNALDLDGFVTRLSTSGTTTATESSTTYRVRSYDGAKDTVHGICMPTTTSSQSSSDFVYVTGTTQGYIEDDTKTPSSSSSSRDTLAFLAQIHMPNMTATWIQHIQGVDGTIVQGISCAVTDSGDAVYFGGNVVSGFIPNNSSGDAAESIDGESDNNIFVAKVDTLLGSPTEGQVLFVRQFGSTDGVDWMAQKGGLVTRPDGSVVIVGNTQGTMYRARTSSEQDFSTVFAVTMASDGTFTAPIQAGLVSGDLITEMPTFASVESPSTTPAPTSGTAAAGEADQAEPLVSVAGRQDGTSSSSAFVVVVGHAFLKNLTALVSMAFLFW